jgi:hypothetical protein
MNYISLRLSASAVKNKLLIHPLKFQYNSEQGEERKQVITENRQGKLHPDVQEN